MALVEGGEIGVDEGGILQALATPIIHREVVHERKLKKGVKTETTTLQITGAQVLALILGPTLLALFMLRFNPQELKDLLDRTLTHFQTPEAQQDLALRLMQLLGHEEAAYAGQEAAERLRLAKTEHPGKKALMAMALAKGNSP